MTEVGVKTELVVKTPTGNYRYNCICVPREITIAGTVITYKNQSVGGDGQLIGCESYTEVAKSFTFDEDDPEVVRCKSCFRALTKKV